MPGLGKLRVEGGVKLALNAVEDELSRLVLFRDDGQGLGGEGPKVGLPDAVTLAYLGQAFAGAGLEGGAVNRLLRLSF